MHHAGYTWLALWTFMLQAFPLGMMAESIRINEWYASGSSTLVDEDGEPSDWIEIWNPSPDPIALQGYYLSDDLEYPDKWRFPNIKLAPGDYLLVMASGKDRGEANKPLHTNFQLDQQGEGLILSHMTATGLAADTVIRQYPRQREGYSFGYASPESEAPLVYFDSPTPGRVNATNHTNGFVSDTTFSVDRGYYDSPFDLKVTCKTPGARLVYTTDGSEPQINHGQHVVPIAEDLPPLLELRMTSTTLLRVMAFKEGMEPSNIDSQTYFFASDLLDQSGLGSPFDQSVNWGHAGPDWAMDPVITQHADARIRPEAVDFHGLPSLSIGMSFTEMFGNGGIYIAGQGVEKNVSVEWINPEGNPQEPNREAGFQTRATVQIVGGSSPSRWKSDKLSMRLKFDKDLRYPMFGPEATSRFDTLVVDARLNNVWHYGGGSEPVGQRDRAQYVRDQYAANLHTAMGGTSPHGQHAHVFINGIYWGIHTIHERPDDNFAASYLGGDNEDYDVIKHTPTTVVQGSNASYLRLMQLAQADLGQAANWSQLESLLDVNDFIDYMLVNYYIGNGDWAHHNWYASYNRSDPAGRWRFHSWDAEKGLHRVTDDVTNRDDSGGPTFLHHRLIQNPLYRMRFADRAWTQLTRGILSPDLAAQLYRAISEPLDGPIRLESARWGDNQRARAYTRLDWVEIRDSLFGLSQNRSLPTFDYFARRSSIVLGQFRSKNWIPSIDPPVFSQQGGILASTSPLTMQSEQGTIFYTIDGTDPMGQSAKVISREETTLVSELAIKKAWMPENDNLDHIWFEPNLDDSNWPSGQQGAGYENGSGYENFIAPSLDFSGSASSQNAETIYMRIHFTLDDMPTFDQLSLGVRYDDGFIAYLNGKEVARSNAPGSIGNPAAWNASASASHSDSQATIFEVLDITAEGLTALRQGDNVLAIHGLNVSNSSSDFLIWPVLTASTTLTEKPIDTEQEVFSYQGPINLKSSTLLKARTFDGTQWSALNQAHFLVNTLPASSENLVLSQIHYHPAAPSNEEIALGFDQRSDFEFLQISNTSQESVDLRGILFTDGITFDFQKDSSLMELAAGATCVVVANPQAYSYRFGPQEPIAGSFQQRTNLSNARERLIATDAGGELIWDITYDDQEPWPILADGQGYYLARLPSLDFPNSNSPEAWEAIKATQNHTLPPPWTLSLVAPQEQALIVKGRPVEIAAAVVSEQNVSMARVTCLVNGMSIGQLTQPPYRWEWIPEETGQYILQIQGWDRFGQFTTSEAVRLIAIPDSDPVSARIAWVSFHTAPDAASPAARAAGMIEAPDATYTHLLEQEGYEVVRMASSSNPDMDRLQSHDLVIISRSVASGDYATNEQVAAWHSLETPVMMLGGYITRSSRLGFTMGTTMTDTSGTIHLRAEDATHPVFDGIRLGTDHIMAEAYAEPVTLQGVIQRGISINQNPLWAGGKLIATNASITDNAFGGTVIAEWEKGTTMNSLGEYTLAGKRMLFLTGSREASGYTSETAGIYDLTEEGGQMFLNAVRYLTPAQESKPISFVAIEKGDQGLWIYYSGTLQSAPTLEGPWSDVTDSQNPYPASSIADNMQFFRSIP